MNGHLVVDGVQIDPWGSSQYQDYARLRDEFGIAGFGPAEWSTFRQPHRLFRRGVVFGHRDFERVADAVRRRDPWAMMTGFMPSGDLHMGHKMVLEQAIAHQREGADVTLALADFEAMAARGMPAAKAHAIALDQYVHNALALGLDGSAAPFYFQTRRVRVRDLADRFAQRVNLSQLQAMYGFGGDTSLAHMLAPLVQAADILHPQLEGAGPRPVLVPVGVDQDPHVRLTRDIAGIFGHYAMGRAFHEAQSGKPGRAAALTIAVRGHATLAPEEKRRRFDRLYAVLEAAGIGTRSGAVVPNEPYGLVEVLRPGLTKDAPETDEERLLRIELARADRKAGELGFVPPTATFHRFMTGLQGGKMSSSKPETSIYLTEEPKVAEKKLRSAVTGGRQTAEEQRRIGAEPHKCPVYELYLYHLAKDDAHLQQVHDECSTGARLCGGCKGEAAGLLLEFLKGHKERRDEVAHQVAAAVSQD